MPDALGCSSQFVPTGALDDAATSDVGNVTVEAATTDYDATPDVTEVGDEQASSDSGPPCVFADGCCRPEARTSGYELFATSSSGTCGSTPYTAHPDRFFVYAFDSPDLPAYESLTYSDSWSDDGCTLTRDIRFTWDCISTGGVDRWHIVSTALNEAASELEGTLVESEQGCEGLACEGTWQIHATRSAP